MTAYGTRAEKLSAYANVGKTGINDHRLYDLCIDALQNEFSVENVIAVPEPIRGIEPPDKHGLPFSSCLLQVHYYKTIEENLCLI